MVLDLFTSPSFRSMFNFDDFFFTWPTDPKPPIASWKEVTQQEKDDSVILQLAVAGFKTSDIKVWTEENTLHIEGDNTGKENVADKFRHKFHRTFVAGQDLDLKNTTISLEEGILTIKIPIIQPEVKRNYLFGSAE